MSQLWSYLSPEAKGPVAGLNDTQLLAAARNGFLKPLSLVSHPAKTRGRWRVAEQIPDLATWFDPNTDLDKGASDLANAQATLSPQRRLARVLMYSLVGFLSLVIVVLAVIGGMRVYSLLTPPPIKQFEQKS